MKLLLSFCAVTFAVSLAHAQPPSAPLVIAHRGASGYLPEHTLEAAAFAYAQGADFIEQDLVMSRDDVLVVCHDITLETKTDVARVFPERKRPDGRYYAVDFSWAELRTLRVR
jgi:glycerophosphoryl diester phosphodiesterase